MSSRIEFLGILCVIVGANCAVVAHSFVRLLKGVPLLDVIQVRFGLQCCVMTLVVAVLRWKGHNLRFFGVPGQQHLLLLRSTAFLAALGFGWTAMQKLPIGVATGIVYSNPVLSGLLASYILRREKLSTAFAVQAIVCLTGTALIIPTAAKEGGADSESNDYFVGTVAAVVSACLHAVCPCAVRMMEGVHPLEIQLFQDAFATLATIPLAAMAGGPTVDVEVWSHVHFSYVIYFTVAGLTASFLFIAGWRMAPVTKASLFTYTEIPTSFIVQVYLFQDIPAARQVLGASMIVIATCVRLRCESYGFNDNKASDELVPEDHKDADDVENEPLLSEERRPTSQSMRRLQPS